MAGTAVVWPSHSYASKHLCNELKEKGFQVVAIENEGPDKCPLFKHPENEQEWDTICSILAKASLIAVDAGDIDSQHHLEVGMRLLASRKRCEMDANQAKSPTTCTFIAISSPLTWAGCLASQSDFYSNDEAANGPLHVHRRFQYLEEMGDYEARGPSVGSLGPQAHGQVVCDACKQRRVPFPGAQRLKVAEDIILQSADAHLATVVLVPGVLYGHGEWQLGFRAEFVKAWSGDDTTALCVYGSGANIIPTLHVSELASAVACIALAKSHPPSQYVLLADEAPSSQREITQAISTGMGSGHLVTSSDESIFMTAGAEHMLINIAFQSSAIPGHCSRKGGLPATIGSVRSEFIAAWHLEPIRIVVQGPPCSGKSTLAWELGLRYTIPVYSAGDLLTAVGKLPEAQAAAVEGLLRNKDKSRLNARQMALLCRAAVSNVRARNRGFILDGYPKTLLEAREAFTDAEAEADADERQKMHVTAETAKADRRSAKATAKSIAPISSIPEDVPGPRHACQASMPNVLVMLDADIAVLQARCRAAREDAFREDDQQAEGARQHRPVAPDVHFSDTNFARRLALYQGHRMQDVNALEAKRLAIQAKWDEEDAKEEEMQRQAAERAAYTASHQRRRRNPTFEKANAHEEEEGSNKHLREGQPVGTPERQGSGSAYECNGCGSDLLKASMQRRLLPRRAGYAGFFDDSGASVIDVQASLPSSELSQRDSQSHGISELADRVCQMLRPPHCCGPSTGAAAPRAPTPVHASEGLQDTTAHEAPQPALTHADEGSCVTDTGASQEHSDGPQIRSLLYQRAVEDLVPAVVQVLTMLASEATRPADPVAFIADQLLSIADQQDAAAVDPYAAPAYAERRRLVASRRDVLFEATKASQAKAMRERDARLRADATLKAMLLDSARRHESMVRG